MKTAWSKAFINTCLASQIVYNCSIRKRNEQRHLSADGDSHGSSIRAVFFFSIFTWHLSDANQRERDERPGGIKPANLCKAAKVSHKSSFAKTTIVRGQHRCQWPHQEWREIMWVPRDRLPSRTQRHTVQGCRVKLLGPDTQTHCSQRPGRECTSCTGEGGTTAWGASGQLLQCNNSVCSLPPPSLVQGLTGQEQTAADIQVCRENHGFELALHSWLLTSPEWQRGARNTVAVRLHPPHKLCRSVPPSGRFRALHASSIRLLFCFFVFLIYNWSFLFLSFLCETL